VTISVLGDSIKGTLFVIALKRYYVMGGAAFPTEIYNTDHLDSFINTNAILRNSHA
jgi:hypothetical protein